MEEILQEYFDLYEYKLLAKGDKFIYYLDLQTKEEYAMKIETLIYNFIHDLKNRLLIHINEHDTVTIDGYIEDISKFQKLLGGRYNEEC